MPPSKNAYLLRDLVADADSLASSVAKRQFPVFLRPIAERRKVTSVKFCPLLVDAMLTTHPDGFRILLNSNGVGVRQDELLEQYNSESKEKMLPPRLRFSIAHELAHTFFYDLSKACPSVAKKFTSGGGRTELENLERHCNTLASHLLLPTPIFATEFLRLKAINPQAIIDIANKAGVSIEALLWRLNKSDSLFVKKYFRGSIVYIDYNQGQLKIEAIARPKSLNIAYSLLRMRARETWKLQARDGFELNPTVLPPISYAFLDVATERATSAKRYKICILESRRFEGKSSFLVTFEEEGVPIKFRSA